MDRLKIDFDFNLFITAKDLVDRYGEARTQEGVWKSNKEVVGNKLRQLIANVARLRLASAALQGVTVCAAPFAHMLDHARPDLGAHYLPDRRRGGPGPAEG